MNSKTNPKRIFWLTSSTSFELKFSNKVNHFNDTGIFYVAYSVQ